LAKCRYTLARLTPRRGHHQPGARTGHDHHLAPSPGTQITSVDDPTCKAVPGTDYTLSAVDVSIPVPANSTVDYTRGLFMPLVTTASFPGCLSRHNFSVDLDITATSP